MKVPPSLYSLTGVTLDASRAPDDSVSELLLWKHNRKGEPTVPVPVLDNIVTILDIDSRWKGRIRFCEFRSRMTIDDKPVTDEIETGVALWMADVYALRARTSMVAEALRFVASQNKWHPVRDYLQGLTWDGTNRSHLLLSAYFGAQDNDLTRELGMRFLISCVARVMKPGCKVDTTLVLYGEQSEFKSTGLATLVPQREWFSDSTIDLHSKDAYQNLPGVWIYEFGEMDSIRRRDATVVKAFLSAQVDRYRPSYGRNVIQVPRQTVFTASTNEPTFLNDPSGSRRFWPVEVQGVQCARIEADRDQLWAEAITLYSSGERWWLDRNAEAVLRDSSLRYEQEDPWTQSLEAWLVRQGTTPFQIGQALTGAIDKEIDRAHGGDSMRMASLLKRLGCERRSTSVNGKRGWWWIWSS